jgi:hypothetical protein
MVEPGILFGLKENAQDMRMSPRPLGGGFRIGRSPPTEGLANIWRKISHYSRPSFREKR